MRPAQTPPEEQYGAAFEAPHGVLDSDATSVVVGGGLEYSKGRWETLPIIAKQLTWDSTNAGSAGRDKRGTAVAVWLTDKVE